MDELERMSTSHWHPRLPAEDTDKDKGEIRLLIGRGPDGSGGRLSALIAPAMRLK